MRSYKLKLKLMLGLRGLAVVSCAFGAYRLFSVGSPLGVMLLVLIVPQLFLAHRDVKELQFLRGS